MYLYFGVVVLFVYIHIFTLENCTEAASFVWRITSKFLHINFQQQHFPFHFVSVEYIMHQTYICINNGIKQTSDSFTLNGVLFQSIVSQKIDPQKIIYNKSSDEDD